VLADKPVRRLTAKSSSCCALSRGGTWGMCGLYACLRNQATEQQIDESLRKLATARVIRADSIGSWILIRASRPGVARAGTP